MKNYFLCELFSNHMSSENPSSHYKPGSIGSEGNSAVRKKFLLFSIITLFPSALFIGYFASHSGFVCLFCILHNRTFLEIKFQILHPVFGIFSLYNFDDWANSTNQKSVDQSKDRKRVFRNLYPINAVCSHLFYRNSSPRFFVHPDRQCSDWMYVSYILWLNSDPLFPSVFKSMNQQTIIGNIIQIAQPCICNRESYTVFRRNE